MGVQPPALPCTSLHTQVHSSPLHIKKTNFFFWKQHWKTLLSQSNFPLTYSEVSAPATRFPPHLSHVPLLLHHPISAGRTALFYKISSPHCAFPCPPSHHLSDRHQQHAVLPSHTLTCSDLPAPPCTNPCQAPRSGDGCGDTGRIGGWCSFLLKRRAGVFLFLCTLLNFSGSVCLIFTCAVSTRAALSPGPAALPQLCKRGAEKNKEGGEDPNPTAMLAEVAIKGRNQVL